ncbi:ribonucleoside-diphosphate reductase subunit alpha [Pelagibius sp. Alg239-R121]|uniref:ribonucleoside-diphosphate reductase subunit alpha n=1 Tax=Pelagibius sp. Alg239-R121 TaxID=2993448 RepID=UPI0024A6FDA2|nr:ribonucleoside-diphosphate reductase subunit alpha [Pelagibius sp. Alg239-R121]
MDGSGVLLREDVMTISEESVDKSSLDVNLGSLQNESAPIQAEMFGELEMAPKDLPNDQDEALLGDGEIRDIFQNERGIRVVMDRTRDDLLTAFGKATLTDRYLMDGESFQDLFARVAAHFADDTDHAQRLYDAISRLWFMPSTPVLSNGGTTRGLPISCFLNEAGDSLDGIVDLWNENVWLAARGGGIGSYWGNLRSIGERVGHNGKTSGVIPFIRVMDSLTLAISQGSLRRGSAACYMPVTHPEIEEFIELRRPTGGDPNRKALNLHHGVLLTDAFMRAVENDDEWALTSPKDHAVIRKVKARDLWIRILTARIETGEPYIIYGDHINRAIPEHHKLAGLNVKMSNLCSEITLPTGIDHHGVDRTAVCCLSSLNLDKYFEWKDEEGFVEDIMRFLDNVLSDFIAKAPDSMARARYSAERERSVGLGVMGFHSFLQKHRIPIEGVMAKVWNKKIFEQIRSQADAASKLLAEERGACLDAEEFGIMERFSNKMAIAPTASISIICGGSSPGIEPMAGNSFTHKTLSGSFNVRNKYLEELLEEKGHNDEDTWTSITLNEGSVQHLEFLSDDEKDVFKTAFELDQRWLIEHAADRTPFICQAQSLNVFVPADVHKRDLHQIHFQAWKKGVKSLYYCRSKSMQRAESANSNEAVSSVPHLGKIDSKGQDRSAAPASTDYEECLACQ